MINQSVGLVIQAWRREWTRDRFKHDLGPTEQSDWEEYLNSLTMAEVLKNLEIYSD